ncbi:TPA: hypothetical protein HA297_00670 [Candidatus Woesearchaeota archaeon]|nr:hypothetical protein [Candidatus Woesearchaeota archaeon]
MMFVADTGALLSLGCSSHFQLVLKEYTLYITPAVEEEIAAFASYDDFLGLKAAALQRISLRKEKPKKLLPLNLENAETEVFSLAIEKHCSALSDDIPAIRIATQKKIGISIKPSFYLLLLLYKRKKITKEDMVQDIKFVLVHRNWLHGALWEYALKQIEEL